MSTIKHERENRKYKQLITEQEQIIQELRKEIENLKLETTPEFIEDEVFVKFYNFLVNVSKQPGPFQEDCKVLLETSPSEIIDDVREKYINKGLETAINFVVSKAEIARDFGSDVTAITAESIADGLRNLL